MSHPNGRPIWQVAYSKQDASYTTLPMLEEITYSLLGGILSSYSKEMEKMLLSSALHDVPCTRLALGVMLEDTTPMYMRNGLRLILQCVFLQQK